MPYTKEQYEAAKAQDQDFTATVDGQPVVDLKMELVTNTDDGYTPLIRVGAQAPEGAWPAYYQLVFTPAAFIAYVKSVSANGHSHHLEEPAR